jgi:CBS domain-containing protein
MQTANNISIKQIMTTDVMIVSPNDSMQKVHDIFQAQNIHHLPVVDDSGKVVGIVSKTDYNFVSYAFPLFRSEKREEANVQLFESLLVEDVMTKQVATLGPDDPISLAGGFFRENLFHAIPVVDLSDRLVGILSTYDLLNYFFEQPAFLEN